MDFLVKPTNINTTTTTITINYHYHDHWSSSLIFLCLYLFSSQIYEGHERRLYYRAVFVFFLFLCKRDLFIRDFVNFFVFKIYNCCYCKYLLKKKSSVLINCCRLSSCLLMNDGGEFLKGGIPWFCILRIWTFFYELTN